MNATMNAKLIFTLIGANLCLPPAGQAQDADDRRLMLLMNAAISLYGMPEDLMATVFDGWKTSTGHHETMINRAYTHFGYAHISCADKRTIHPCVFGEQVKLTRKLRN